MTFIFGGNTGNTYDSIQQRRKIAQQLAYPRPKNVGEGMLSIADALVSKAIDRKATRDETKLKDQFAEQFSQAAPQSQAMVDLYNNPMASDAHKKILGALMAKGVPGFSRGGTSRGGMAVVGERGPELVQLAPGAKVSPLEDELDALMESVGSGTPDDAPPEVLRRMDEIMRELNPPTNAPPKPIDMENFHKNERQQYDPNYDPAMDREMEHLRDEQRDSRFDDANAYQVAQSGEMALPYGDEKMTGDQSKAIAYYRRGYGANQTLDDPKMAEALTQHTDTFSKRFGGIGRVFQDADFQVADRAAQEFLAAILRKDTGAAITQQEFELYGPMYLPQPGDKPELLAAKRKARAEALTAIEMGLGTVAPLAVKVREELKPKDSGATHRFNPETGEIEEIK